MKKMYVIVRKDLGPIYKMVQGSHAVCEFSLEFPDLWKEWNNQYIIYLEVKNERELINWILKLKKSGKKFSRFCEPDLHYQVTGISCYDNGKIFANLKLAK